MATETLDKVSHVEGTIYVGVGLLEGSGVATITALIFRKSPQTRSMAIVMRFQQHIAFICICRVVLLTLKVI